MKWREEEGWKERKEEEKEEEGEEGRREREGVEWRLMEEWREESEEEGCIFVVGVLRKGEELSL